MTCLLHISRLWTISKEGSMIGQYRKEAIWIQNREDKKRATISLEHMAIRRKKKESLESHDRVREETRHFKNKHTAFHIFIYLIDVFKWGEVVFICIQPTAEWKSNKRKRKEQIGFLLLKIYSLTIQRPGWYLYWWHTNSTGCRWNVYSLLY